MRKQKRWVGIVTLTALTAAALFGGIALRKSFAPIPAAVLSVEGYEDLGIREASQIVDGKGNITGYRVLAESKGFAEEPIVLAVTFNSTADQITAVEVISHQETEGYGSKIMEDSFLKQFIGVELPVYLEGKKSAATPTPAPVTPVSGKLQDGVYVERASEAHNGYISEVVLSIEGGKITGVVWDCYDETGAKKSVLSETGKYVMTETGPTWAEQAKSLAAYVIEHQGVDGLTLNDEGKTDAVSGVSIGIGEFIDQVTACLSRAAAAKTAMPEKALGDGTFTVRSDEADNGYYSEVSLTVTNGRISSLVWDNIDENGNYKSVLSETGQYVMTENGPTWAAQAKAAATYVIEHQGLNGLILNQEGKTDAVASVSIAIGRFTEQVEECLAKSAKAAEQPEAASGQLQDGLYVERASEAHNGYISEVSLTIKDGAITDVIWDCYDETGAKKSVLSETGKYVMTENGPTWAEQAKSLAAYVIEHQGVKGLTMNDEGKTDAVSGVSIAIGEFVDQVTACLSRAAAAKTAMPEKALGDGTFTVRSDEADNGYYSEVSLTVTNGRISSLVWDNIDESGNYKSVLSETGQYVMTENGPTWAAQAKAAATYVIEHQGLNGLVLNQEGKTDAVASVSIAIGRFAEQVEACLTQAEAAAKNGAASKLQDGLYVERASEAHNGYISEVSLTIKDGAITDVVWDCYDETGARKSVLSETGKYVMTENGPIWAEQAKSLAAYVIEHQGVEGLTMNDEGKTDAVSGVSIAIGEFVDQVTACLTRAAAAKEAKPETALGDGTYHVRSDEADNGYYSELSLTVSNGRITSVVWDNIDETGAKKSILSENGEYVMTENGPTWAKQAEAVATYVVEHQGLNGLVLNQEGKTDAVASVSIAVGRFTEQVKECLTQAEAAVKNGAGSKLQDGLYVERASEAHNGYTSEVSLTIKNGAITDVVWDCYDETGAKKSVLSETGKYVMTEDGPTWAEQAKSLAAYVIEHQGVDGLTLNDEGKTDAVSGVSIAIDEFVEQVRVALTRAAETVKPEASGESLLQDGVYVERAAQAENGYTSQFTMTVKDGDITKVVWDAVDADGNGKAQLSREGRYVMTDTGLLWAEQAEALAAYVLEHQGTDGLTFNDEGKTDAISGVSISIQDFVTQAEACLARAAAAKAAAPSVTLSDGVYKADSEEIDGSGYTSHVTLTVANGRISEVIWECINADGETKRILSQTGVYVMTEHGPTWAEQADALATYVIEHQGLTGLTAGENGKTDAIATVSIGIADFTSQVEECLRQAAGGSGVVTADPTQTPTAAPTPSVTEAPEATQVPQEGTKVDGISGASYSSRGFVAGINNAYEYLRTVLKEK